MRASERRKIHGMRARGKEIITKAGHRKTPSCVRTAEARLLCIMPLQRDAPCGVRDVVRRDRRVVRHLLYDEVRAPAPTDVRPVPIEQPAWGGTRERGTSR